MKIDVTRKPSAAFTSRTNRPESFARNFIFYTYPAGERSGERTRPAFGDSC